MTLSITPTRSLHGSDTAIRERTPECRSPPTMIQAWNSPAVGVDRFTTNTAIGAWSGCRRGGVRVVRCDDVEQTTSAIATSESGHASFDGQHDSNDEKRTALGREFFVDTVNHVTIPDASDEAVASVSPDCHFRPRIRQRRKNTSNKSILGAQGEALQQNGRRALPSSHQAPSFISDGVDEPTSGQAV